MSGQAIELKDENDQVGATAASASTAPAGGAAVSKGRAEFLKCVLEEIPKLQEDCRAYVKSSPSRPEPELFSRFHCRVRDLFVNAEQHNCARLACLTKNFDALLAGIAANPSSATPSTLQTMSQAVDVIKVLAKKDEVDPVNLLPQAKAVIVDDDMVCNRVLANALKRANFDAQGIQDPIVAMRWLQKNHYDLVLLDINMPNLTGFGVCEKIRTLPHHKTTPIFFVTSENNLESRKQGVLSGGNDFIVKPVAPLELTLKAVIYVLKTREQPANSPQAAVKVSEADSAKKAQKNSEPAVSAEETARENGRINGAARLPESEPTPAPRNGEAKAANVIAFPAPADAQASARVLKNPIQTIEQNRNHVMQDETKQPFDKIAREVTRIIFGDGDVSELHVRLVRIALERSCGDPTQPQPFEKIVREVAQIIFGENASELNLRLVRIALEQYKIAESVAGHS